MAPTRSRHHQPNRSSGCKATGADGTALPVSYPNRDRVSQPLMSGLGGTQLPVALRSFGAHGLVPVPSATNPRNL